MTNTEIVRLIRAMQPVERQEMAAFLASAQSGKAGNSNDLSTLYQTILDAAPEFSDLLLKKERIYAQVFPGQALVQGKLEKLMTELKKALRSFALSSRYFSTENEEQQQLDWAAWLREHGMAERSRAAIDKLKANLAEQKKDSLKRHRTMLDVLEEEHFWEVTFNKIKGGLNVPDLINCLDLYYLNYRIDRVNRYLLQQKGAQLPNIDLREPGLENSLEESPLLKIAFNIFEVLKKDIPSVEETRALMNLLQSNEENLSFETLEQFYAYLRNFCTLLINGGHLEFVLVLHHINKDNLERGYFFLDGKLPPHSYLNIVQVSIRAKDFEWARAFTEIYKGQLVEGDEGQFYYKVNLAHCFFAAGKMDEALNNIPDMPSTIHYNRLLRRLELKIYYEQRSELLQFKLDAFRKYVERTAPKMIAANLREMDLNFLYILNQLSNSPFKDKARSARLIKRIEEKKLLSDRSWLIEKAQELA